MRRLSIVVVLALASLVWPAAVGGASAAAQAVGSLQADFDNDGFADLATGALFGAFHHECRVASASAAR